MKYFLFFNTRSQGLLVHTSYFPSGDIKRTTFKGGLNEGYPGIPNLFLIQSRRGEIDERSI